MKITNIVTKIIAVTSLLAMLSGCDSSTIDILDNLIDPGVSSDYIIEKCESMYDDTFTLQAANTQIWSADYAEVILHSEKLDEDITVWYQEEGSNEWLVSNYMPIKYKSQVEDAVSNLAKQVYGDCIVYNAPISHGSMEITSETSLSEYMSNPYSSLANYIAVESDPATGDSDIEKFVKLLKEHNILTDFTIYYHDTLDSVDKPEEFDNLFPNFNKALHVLVDKDYTISYSSWTDNPIKYYDTKVEETDTIKVEETTKVEDTTKVDDPGDPVETQPTSLLTLDTLLKIAEKGTEIAWEDFDGYTYEDIGSGLYIYVYDIDDTFELHVGGFRTFKPSYIRLALKEDNADFVDVQNSSIDEINQFIDKNS